MSRPKPGTDLEWRREIARDLNIQKRRGRGADLGLGGSVRMALLDPAYRGEGPARVTFEGFDALSDDAYNWQRPYIPWESRSVTMMRVGGTWEITGQSGAEGYGGVYRVPLPKTATTGKWNSYHVRMNDPTWAPWEIVRYASGIVVHRGLSFPVDAASIAAGTVIANIPEPYRPDGTMFFMVNNGDLARSVSITAAGDVVVGANWSNNYLSMSGTVAYPAAGVATWTAITAQGSGTDHAFANGWVPYDAVATNQPGYWMDPYGFVWLRGLVRNPVVPGTDNSLIFGLPVTHRAHAEMHIITARYDDLGLVGASPTVGGLHFKTGVGYGANQWLSLAGITIVTPQARSANPWYDVPYFVNSYGNFGGVYTKLGMLRRGDGLGIMAGLGQAPASLGNWPFILEPELMPRKQVLFNNVSSNVRGRFDVYGFDRDSTNRPMGSFSQVQGTASGWFSLDSIKVMPG